MRRENQGQAPSYFGLTFPRIPVTLAAMTRIARVVVPGVSHHITQRGNNRQDVFFVDDDRRVYLALLKEQCDKHGLAVLAYCLMTNHVHIVGVPESAGFTPYASVPPPLRGSDTRTPVAESRRDDGSLA